MKQKNKINMKKYTKLVSVFVNEVIFKKSQWIQINRYLCVHSEWDDL